MLYDNLTWCPRLDGFYVYVLMLTNGDMYKGYTQWFKERMQQHFNGNGCQTTKRSKPLYILHHEKYNSRKEAFARERYLKTKEGFYWLKNNTELKTLKP